MIGTEKQTDCIVGAGPSKETRLWLVANRQGSGSSKGQVEALTRGKSQPFPPPRILRRVRHRLIPILRWRISLESGVEFAEEAGDKTC